MTFNSFNLQTTSIQSILQTIDDKSNFLSLYKSSLKQFLENKRCNNLLDKLYKFEWHTFEHCVNVSVIAAAIYYNELKNSTHKKTLKYISLTDVVGAGLFHDIGKIMISKNILLSKRKLTKHEKRIISLHPVFGYNLLINVPISHSAKKGVLYHHSDNNEESSIVGRILKIADVYDALIAKRSYKEAKTPIEAGTYLLDNQEKQFDNSFLATIERIVELYREEEFDYEFQIN